MERQISLEQGVDAATQSLRDSMHHVMPGAVVSYDANTQRANIQPMTNDARTNIDTGQPYFEPWPVLPDVPILWPRFGGFMISGPLAKGNPVILLAWDLDPSTWIAQGKSSPGSTQAVNPADVRRHGGGYWIAIPLNVFGPIASAAAAANGMVLGKDGDQAQIQFQAGSIQLGATGGDFLALASKVLTQLNAIQAALGGLTCPNSGTGPVPVTSTSPYSPGPVASSLVKAQ